ncbi:MAG: type II toxin-antitoxin system VapC family toxin [Candidatus Aminicenantes bacterium]|nr:type II toxin-antitoxin system VapC family toxin [Candidatus Aminicenantes bacterium]
MIVADTNLVVHLYVESESSPMARQVMLRDPDWTSPILWRSEFRNTLVKCLRGGLLRPDQAFRIMAAAETMMAGREFHVASDDVLDLAAASDCSAYDAEYVVLARGTRLPLVTTDKELLEKFPGTAVTPEMFLAR